MCRGTTAELIPCGSDAATSEVESLDSMSQVRPKSPLWMVHQPYSSAGIFAEPLEAPRRPTKEWLRIPVDSYAYSSCATPNFPEGWTFKVYDGNLQNFFEIRSEEVQPTHGAIRYIEHFNEMGPYTRFRFQLCNNFLGGHCRKGFECTYVHALSLPRAYNVHVNGQHGYETLPPGYCLDVYTPSQNAPPQSIPTHYILHTLGSEKAFKDMVTRKCTFRGQHCAHYQYKRICNLGDRCSFIHSIVPVSS